MERDEQDKVIRFDTWDDSFHMTDIDLNDDIGYLLEVDITIPENIRDKRYAVSCRGFDC